MTRGVEAAVKLLLPSRRHFLRRLIEASSARARVKPLVAARSTRSRPDRAIGAAMNHLNAERGGKDLLLKIGIHEGPCLAVMLNDRQDYFGHFSGGRVLVVL